MRSARRVVFAAMDARARRLLEKLAEYGEGLRFAAAVSVLDPQRYPRTVAYVERIMARPSLAHWIERESAFLAKNAA